MKGANLVGAKVAGADFTRADLTAAVLMGIVASNLKLAYANLTSADLRNAQLPDANLAHATLVGAKVTGTQVTALDFADLSGSDFSYADLSNADFTKTDLQFAILTGANATKANFTGANLYGTMLAKTDLSGANLTEADLGFANLITATLTNAVWSNTGCPHGSRSDSACSPFAIWPGTEYKTGGPSWYQARSLSSPQLPSRPLLGTPDAPLAWSGDQGWPDGIQGNITNLTGQRIVVRNVQYRDKPKLLKGVLKGQATDPVLGSAGNTNEAILEPNAVMPYRLAPGGILEFYKAPEGEPVGPASRLYISDNLFSTPTSWFYPPGWADPVNQRQWQPETTHEEIWGSTKLWVRRELDGWKIPASQNYVKRYGEQNTWMTSDWAIFTIEVRGL